MASAWRTLRIFISSTFRDMQSERDHLVRVVFPELRERCARRRLHLVDVDLRWGVTEEEAERGRVLEICLDEIERCRPFFVGILGERYGSVLPSAAAPDDPSYDWLRGLEQEHSVTALEIYHGVLRSPGLQTRSFFYFRDPAFLSSVPAEMRDAFLPESPEASQKLAALKNEIRDQCPVFEKYPCSYAGQTDGRVILGGLEAFGQRVLEDLWSAINEEYLEEVLPPDELSVERNYHEAFIETRVQRFIGRADLLRRMSDYAGDDGQSTLVVVGEPGSGKSALLAKFAREYSRDHPDAFVLAHFIGASPGSTDIRQTLLRLSRELTRRYNIDARIPEDFQELWQEFRGLVARAGSQGKLVLLIDALNQLDDANDPQALHWLPANLPAGVRVIVSVLEGDFLSALRRRRPAPDEIVVGPLSDDERRALVRQTLWEYRKQLDERPENDQMGRLLAKAESDNPLYLIVACEELRLFGEFERVTARVERLPGDTEALFEQVLERIEVDLGADIVRDSLTLLECSRHGLLEIEMLEMLRRPGEEQLPRAVWAALYRGLRFYLQPTGEAGEGTLDFFHRQLAKAVRKRYLAGDSEPQVHARLARFFRSKIDPRGDRRWKQEYPRGLSELPHHLLNAEAYDDLFALARDASFVETVAGAFSADPQLTLESLRAAIEAAARVDDAGLMAEFVLANARRRADLAEESPLDALRRGEIDRCWELADMHPAQRCALWHLILAWELKDAGRSEQARATLDRLAQRELPRLSHYHWPARCALKLLARIAGISEPLFQSIQERLLEDDSREDLCHALADAGQVQAARLVAEGVANEPTRNTALHMVGKGQLVTVSRQASEGDFASAMETLRDIRDDWSRTAALREIASAHAARGLHDQARAGFVAAVEGASLGRRWQAPALALRDIGVEQNKAGYSDDAMKTFRAAAEAAREHNPYLSEKQHLPDVAEAVAEAGDIDTALVLAREVSWGSGKILRAVAAVHLRSDDVTSALSIAKSISNPEDKTKALNLVAITQVRAGQIESGRETFSEARKAALQVRDFSDGANGLRTVAVAEMEAGLADESRATFQRARESIPDGRLGPDEGMLKYLARAQAEAGELSGAVRTAEEIKDDDQRLGTLVDVASELAKRGDHQAAKSILETLVDQAAAAPSSAYRQSTFMQAARGYIANGDLDGAISVVQRSGDNSSFAAQEIVNEVVGHPASSGDQWSSAGLPDFPKAREALGALLQISHRAAAGPQTADPETLLCLARAQVDAADMSGALETARAIPVSSERFDALGSVAWAHARDRNFDLAIELIGEIQNDHRDEPIQSIARELAGAGELDRALTLVDQVDEFWRSAAIANLSGPLARAGEFELARATLEKAGNETGKWMRLLKIANEQITRGHTEAARSTLADAVAAAGEDDSLTTFGLLQIAEAQTLAGFFEDARESFALALSDALREVKRAESETDWSRLSAANKLQAVAQAQARVGEFADALETTRLMRTEQMVWDSRAQARIEGEALRDIAIAHAKMGDFEAAHAMANEIRHTDETVTALTELALMEADAGQMNDNELARAEAMSGPESDFDDEKERAAKRFAQVGIAQSKIGQHQAASATMTRAVEVARGIGFEDARGRALAATVAAQAEIGDFAKALDSAQLIVQEIWLSSALKSIALAQLRGGDVQSAVRTANTERSGRLSLLRSLAEVLAGAGDKENFKRLLLPCADEIKTANGMCALLSRLYPLQLPALAEAVIRAGRGR